MSFNRIYFIKLKVIYENKSVYWFKLIKFDNYKKKLIALFFIN